MFSLCLKTEEIKHKFWLCYYFFKRILEENLSSRKISLFEIKVFLRDFFITKACRLPWEIILKFLASLFQ